MFKINKQKTNDDVKSYVIRIAERNNWKLNQDNETLLDLIEGLKDNFNRLSYYNCPCRDSNEDRKLDSDIICPCTYAKDDIKEFGRCYCALYFDKEYKFDEPIKMIPERRPEEV